MINGHKVSKKVEEFNSLDLCWSESLHSREDASPVSVQFPPPETVKIQERISNIQP